jgi:hypothetical protein
LHVIKETSESNVSQGWKDKEKLQRARSTRHASGDKKMVIMTGQNNKQLLRLYRRRKTSGNGWKTTQVHKRKWKYKTYTNFTHILNRFHPVHLLKF